MSYYNPQKDPRLESMVSFALRCLRDFSTHVKEVVLVDGTGFPSEAARQVCDSLGYRYIATEQQVSMISGYNLGLSELTSPFRGLIANDILVPPNWDEPLLKEMQRTGAWMGCPYLSTSDFLPQQLGLPGHPTFRPTTTTLNVNVLAPSVFEKVGPLDEDFTGNFSDTDYVIRIRRRGGDVIIVNCGRVLHIGAATVRVSTTSGTATIGSDRQVFCRKYPEFCKEKVDLTSSEFCKSRTFGLLLRMLNKSRKQTPSKWMTWIQRLEPYFHRV